MRGRYKTLCFVWAFIFQLGTAVANVLRACAHLIDVVRSIPDVLSAIEVENTGWNMAVFDEFRIKLAELLAQCTSSPPDDAAILRVGLDMYLLLTSFLRHLLRSLYFREASATETILQQCVELLQKLKVDCKVYDATLVASLKGEVALRKSNRLQN
jgi:hypothetical protein